MKTYENTAEAVFFCATKKCETATGFGLLVKTLSDIMRITTKHIKNHL
ncbi:MAG: hypothetical protein BWY61_01817 [Firmicutes bacterium ADurb.Bin354]|nr:MAG: hypothetical protein BWY61_01817 [Firmicutes bacterium ADurb.Bin354]